MKFEYDISVNHPMSDCFSNLLTAKTLKMAIKACKIIPENWKCIIYRYNVLGGYYDGEKYDRLGNPILSSK